MSHQQFYDTVALEEYEAEQDALPAHKRDGYFEFMCDYADYLRQQAKDEAMEKSMMEGI